MPYTIQELKNNEYYQALEDADRIEYNAKIENQRERTRLSGSNANSNNETLRDEDGTFISFEDPDTHLSKQGPWQEILVSSLAPKMRLDEQLDIIINREFKEL